MSLTYLLMIQKLGFLHKLSTVDSTTCNNSSFRHRKKSNTGLSNYIWFLKDNNIQYRMEWRVLCKAKSFNPVTRVCRLCLMEKFYIMYNPADATLNIRDEFYQRCMHKWRYLLMKAKGWEGDPWTNWIFKKTFPWTKQSNALILTSKFLFISVFFRVSNHQYY